MAQHKNTPSLDDTFASFFGANATCSVCGKEVDGDTITCRECVAKGREEFLNSPELAEAIEWLRANPGRYPHDKCRLVVDAGLAEWHEGPENRTGIAWK